MANFEANQRILVKQAKTRVMFTAWLENGPGNYSVKQATTLIYNKVITNSDEYCPHSGIFTAPVAGVYSFSFFYQATGNIKADLRLMKNNTEVIMTSDTNDAVAGNGGNSATLELVKGDTVLVQMAENSGVSAKKGHTSFSGFLVSQPWG